MSPTGGGGFLAARVSYLVDGFNLYHSVRAAVRDSGTPHLRWLDLRSLLSSYLSVFGRAARLEEIHYVTAYAHHLTPQNPDVVTRHMTYVRALQASGIRTEISRFKQKDVYCFNCKRRDRFEEPPRRVSHRAPE